MKSKLTNIETEDGEKDKRTLDRDRNAFGGNRKVRKRRSFKDKNSKYQVKERKTNRDSIGMLLGRLQGRMTSNGGSSMSHRPADKYPDLIKGVMTADRNASAGFKRRPSLEFFKDLRTQLNTSSSGKQQAEIKPAQSGPVKIYQNGTLKASRDGLNQPNLPADSTSQITGSKSSKDTGKSSGEGKDGSELLSRLHQSEAGNRLHQSEAGSRLNQSEAGSSLHQSEAGSRLHQNETDSRLHGIKDNFNQEMILKRHDIKPIIMPRSKGDLTSKEPSQAKQKPNPVSLDVKTRHEPHPQKKIKIPKGFMGILPKYNPHSKADNQKEQEKQTASKLVKKLEKISSKNKRQEINDTQLNKEELPPGMEEHYLIRSLPLPAHKINRGGQERATFYSYNLANERRLVSSICMQNRLALS